MTDALGLPVSYGQADILELGRLGRTFDVVDVGGVLHHMAEPLTGWRVLVSLLRPGGLMRVALYSTARAAAHHGSTASDWGTRLACYAGGHSRRAAADPRAAGGGAGTPHRDGGWIFSR